MSSNSIGQVIPVRNFDPAGGSDKWLIIETEEGDVAVLELVVFAFKAVFAGIACTGGASGCDEVVVGNDFCLDKAFFEVGVNDAGALGRLHADAEGPGADFLLACGEVGGEAE